jgi:hypothetical protein
MFLWKIGIFLWVCMVLQCRRSTLTHGKPFVALLECCSLLPADKPVLQTQTVSILWEIKVLLGCGIIFHHFTYGWLIMMGWDWCLRTTAITGLLFIPQVNVSGELWWWWCQLGIIADSSTRACWQSYQQRHLERVRGMDEGMRILHIQYLWCITGSFTSCKILQHRTSGFTFVCLLSAGIQYIFACSESLKCF